MGSSGLVAVDVDQHGIDGDALLCELERAHGALPDTVVGLTGGGGRHVIFAAPPGVKLRQVPLGPGVDVRVGNGYIVAPPGVHASGRSYVWDAEHHPLDIAPAPLPGWIVDVLRDDRRGRVPAAGRVRESLLARAFSIAGFWVRAIDDQRAAVLCPWRSQHTTGRDGDSSTVIFAPTTPNGGGAFFCAHEHCRRRTHAEVLAVLPPAAVQRARAESPRALEWERLVLGEVSGGAS
jgi:hypothetical protein